MRDPTGFSCPVCGGRPRRRRYHVGKWSVVECAACGLLTTWPQPDEGTLAEVYASANYYAEREMATSPGADATSARARDLLRIVGGGPLLDYGAGSGHVVHGARSLGVEADGVEPSSAGRRIAKEIYGVDLLPALPDTGTRRYHAVTLIHVLEHVPDPVETLIELQRVLEPGGGLFIEVPHAGSVRLLPPRQRREVLDLPLHLFHFTPETLGAVLARAGLELTDVRLFNPWFVERLLALRQPTAPSGSADADLATPAGADAPAPAAETAGRTGTTWRRVLRRIRAAAPGEKFQAVARMRARDPGT